MGRMQIKVREEHISRVSWVNGCVRLVTESGGLAGVQRWLGAEESLMVDCARL